MLQLISFEEAINIVLTSVPSIPAETVALAESPGRILAEDVVSPLNVPSFDNSSVDGYAVHTSDLERFPVTLKIDQRIRAGWVPGRPVTPGACAQIMTGAPVPPGTGAVLPVEWTVPGGADLVRFARKIEAGKNIRPAGKDAKAGERVFTSGQVISPPVLGMLAALGIHDVPVRKKPEVAIVVTGDELVEPGAPLAPGQIYNANGPALAAQAVRAGAVTGKPLPARDTPDELEAVIRASLPADVLVISGGVSVGEYDYVKRVLNRMGARLVFWQVRQRPGKPLAFGILDDTPVFCLPGNPVSSSICFEVYVRSALARMMGRPDSRPELCPATLDVTVRKAAGLYTFARGITRFSHDGHLFVREAGPQESNLIHTSAAADCILHLPEEPDQFPAGAVISIQWLEW